MNKETIVLLDKFLEEFNEFGCPNIFQNTRLKDVVQHRQLFHTILRKKYKMTFQAIADYSGYKGRSCKHETIMHSVRQTVGFNYYSSIEIAYIYDQFFDDKKNDRIKDITDNKKVVRISDNKLQELIRDIPRNKEKEIYDLVLLRIRSWSWKNEDKCTIITGM